MDEVSVACRSYCAFALQVKRSTGQITDQGTSRVDPERFHWTAQRMGSRRRNAISGIPSATVKCNKTKYLPLFCVDRLYHVYGVFLDILYICIDISLIDTFVSSNWKLWLEQCFHFLIILYYIYIYIFNCLSVILKQLWVYV